MDDKIQNLEKEILTLRERGRTLESQIELLKERNARVESEKAWETSYFRVLSIGLVTYVVAAALLFAIGVANFLLAALMPSIGYILSTLSFPALKRWWLRRRVS
ncbi:MAG: hypothetical protein HYS26_02195 [Candidatus Kaiserbacteria bacterium]|nr:MAG: hypothetical protein HYS26_02195 [Candidatus Kaiserbacteria bacterium]